MANPELSQRIQELPEELLGLEREPGIVCFSKLASAL